MLRRLTSTVRLAVSGTLHGIKTRYTRLLKHLKTTTYGKTQMAVSKAEHDR